MPIKLNGSSSGYTQIEAADTAGDNTLTLPTASGTLMTTGGTNTFTANQVIEVNDNSNAALRITQLGTGNALVVEDSTNPDSTPFIVDASGNVGVGTASPGAPLEVKGTNDPLLNLNNTGTGSNAIWLSRSGTLHTALYADNSGASNLRNFQSQPMSFWTNNTERMFIGAAGNIGIGTASPGAKFEVSGANFNGGAAIFRSTNSGNSIAVVGVNGAGIYDSAYIYFQDGTPSRDCFIGLTGTAATAGALRFATGGGTERMRLTSSGTLNVGAADAAAANVDAFSYVKAIGGYAFLQHSSGAVSGNWYIGFGYNGSAIGAIVQNGTTGVTYGTGSDYRLKENITPLTNASERLLALKPSRFNFKIEPDRTVDGFIAHEAQAIVPEAVTGEKDAVDADGKPVYQNIDQSKLVPLLTAALQEALTKISALEARIAALENA